jgi:pSer/pThr/pTyr-binding forkhead associated (FHA) protein
MRGIVISGAQGRTQDCYDRFILPMSNITLRILEGTDRGRVFADLDTPITIGREEGNTIQLNDERVSRFHLKIQEDNDKLVLTDLESTNGTKVNGEEIQLRILRMGDMISLGRSTLLLGSRNEISARLAGLKGEVVGSGTSGSKFEESRDLFDFALKLKNDANWQANLYELEPPELPDRLSPSQMAQLSELLEYLHLRMRKLISSAEVEKKGAAVTLDAGQWQYLLDIQSRLSEYLRKAGHPED